MSATQTYIGTLVIEECCDCGIAFGITKDFRERRLADHKLFYCPKGHGQYFSGKSEKEKLQDQVNSLLSKNMSLQVRRDELINEVQQVKYSLRAQKAAKTKIMNRVKNGVCPCCNRSFTDLQRHFATKHPELL